MDHLTANVGMRLDEIQRQTSIDLGLDLLKDDSPIILERPVVLRYPMATRTLDLPATQVIWIDQIAGVVVSLTVAPQLDALALAPARTLAVELAELLLRSGWEPTSGNTAPLATDRALGAEVLARPDHQLYQRNLGEWQSGSSKVTLSLKELLTDSSRRPANLNGVRFLVNLYFNDLALLVAQRKQLVERRLRAGLADDDRMPLKVWMPSR